MAVGAMLVSCAHAWVRASWPAITGKIQFPIDIYLALVAVAVYHLIRRLLIFRIRAINWSLIIITDDSFAPSASSTAKQRRPLHGRLLVSVCAPPTSMSEKFSLICYWSKYALRFLRFGDFARGKGVSGMRWCHKRHLYRCVLRIGSYALYTRVLIGIELCMVPITVCNSLHFCSNLGKPTCNSRINNVYVFRPANGRFLFHFW